MRKRLPENIRNFTSFLMACAWYGTSKEHKFHELALDGKPIEEKQLYSIAVSKYHFMNLQEFLNISLEEAKENALPRVLATSCRDIIEEYMMVTQHLSRDVEGRLVIIEYYK